MKYLILAVSVMIAGCSTSETRDDHWDHLFNQEQPSKEGCRKMKYSYMEWCEKEKKEEDSTE